MTRLFFYAVDIWNPLLHLGKEKATQTDGFLNKVIFS